MFVGAITDAVLSLWVSLWAEELAYCRIACLNKVVAAGGGGGGGGGVVCTEGQSLYGNPEQSHFKLERTLSPLLH